MPRRQHGRVGGGARLFLARDGQPRFRAPRPSERYSSNPAEMPTAKMRVDDSQNVRDGQCRQTSSILSALPPLPGREMSAIRALPAEAGAPIPESALPRSNAAAPEDGRAPLVSGSAQPGGARPSQGAANPKPPSVSDLSQTS